MTPNLASTSHQTIRVLVLYSSLECHYFLGSKLVEQRVKIAVSSSTNETNEAPAAKEPQDIDLSLLEDSLRLTPWQRLMENERALALVRMLEKARTPAEWSS